MRSARYLAQKLKTHPDALIELELGLVILLRVEWVETDLMMLHFRHDLHVSIAQCSIFASTDPLLECGTLFKGKRVRLCDDGHDVDDFSKLFQNRNINLASIAAWD
jgi:hypothetical protein